MNFRGTAILFGLLLTMLWVFGLMLALKKTSVDESYVLPTFQKSTASIDQVVFEKKDGDTVALVRDDKVWRMKPKVDAPGGVKVDSDKVNEVIRQVREARKTDVDIQHDRAKYGLDKPALTVTIVGTDGDKKEGGEKTTRRWQLFVGNQSPVKTDYFVSSSDRPRDVLTVRRSAIDSLFFQHAGHFRPARLLDVSEASLTAIELKNVAKKSELELKKYYDGSWRFGQPRLGFATLEGPQQPKALGAPPPPTERSVRGLINALDALRVGESDFVSIQETNLDSYGLAEGKESFRIVVGSVDINKKPSQETLLIGNKAGDKYYVRRADDPGIAKLPASQLEPILAVLKNPESLRSHDVTHVDAKAIDMVTLRLGKEKIELLHPQDGAWQLQVDGKKKGRAGEKAVQALLEHVRGQREIQKFIEVAEGEAKKVDAELGFESPRAEVVLYTNALEKPEKKEKDDEPTPKKDAEAKDVEAKVKKDAKPAVTLILGKSDKDVVHVKRVAGDGSVSRFNIPTKLAEEIVPPAGVVAFLDTALPVYADARVTGLVLERGGEKVEVARTDDPKKPWLVKKSSDGRFGPADTKNVGVIIHGLTEMDATRWLQKVEPKGDLSKFGLEKPTLTATLRIAKDTPTATMVASTVGFLATEPAALAATVSLRGRREIDPGEIVTIKFGKEAEEGKGKSGTYTLHSGTDYLFLFNPEIVNLLKAIDFRDRSMVLALQPIVDAGAVAAGAEAVVAASPVLSQVVQSVDPARVQEVKLEVRTRAELRRFHFVYDAKDKTWQDKSNLLEFTLDPAKVKTLVEQFAHVQSERIVSLSGANEAEHKFGAKEATLKLDLVLDKGQALTLTVGADFEDRGYFTQTSSWPGVVFLLSRGRITPLLEGAAHFAKERVALRN